MAAADALAYVGLPEATYHLAHATIFLATAPKSNSVGRAISAARQLVQKGHAPAVPPHLRSTGYGGAEELGHGVDYEYPHSDPAGIIRQQYFPDGVDETALFKPGAHGAEQRIREALEDIDRVLGRDRY